MLRIIEVWSNTNWESQGASGSEIGPDADQDILIEDLSQQKFMYDNYVYHRKHGGYTNHNLSDFDESKLAYSQLDRQEFNFFNCLLDRFPPLNNRNKTWKTNITESIPFKEE